MSYFRFIFMILPAMIGTAFMSMAQLNTGSFNRIAVMLLLTMIVLAQNGPELAQVMAGNALSGRARDIKSGCHPTHGHTWTRLFLVKARGRR